MYHTSPMSIGTPNLYFVDKLDKGDPPAFKTFRTDHIRSSVNGKRLIMVGANDGQLHAFKTGEVGLGGGQELWSFIPPNLLPKLKTIVHSTHPTSLDHQYFVDGPLSAADIWLGTGTVGETYKSPTDWYTYLVMSEGRGGIYVSLEFIHLLRFRLQSQLFFNLLQLLRLLCLRCYQYVKQSGLQMENRRQQRAGVE